MRKELKQIKQIVLNEVNRSRANLINEILGRFRDRIPQDVQQELRQKAEKITKSIK